MDIRQQIKKFDEENKPFYMVDHGDGIYSLCLPLSSLKADSKHQGSLCREADYPVPVGNRHGAGNQI